MDSSFRLGRIAGIEVGIHYTWLLAVGFITWSLAGGIFPADYPRWSQQTYWTVAVIATLLLFICVLLHELSHCVVARARGMSVAGITLFIFGGVSNIRGEADKASDEFWMAVVGPLTSLALAAVAWLAWLAIGGGYSPLAAVLRYLANVNLVLALFNLIPGFPLDGGRVLRSVLWTITGDPRRATWVAARIGQGIALLFILGGIVWSLQGVLFSGLWLVFIGWFLLKAAETSYRQLDAPRLPRVNVAAMLRTPPLTVPSSLSVGDLVGHSLPSQGARAALVVDEGRIAGVVSLRDVTRLPADRWRTTPVRAVMTPASRLASVGPEASIQDALALFAERDVNQLPVLQDGTVVGSLSRADVIAYLRGRGERDDGAASEPSPSRPSGAPLAGPPL
jgi:Zn-dependent protease/CBS domain-containing protein